MSHFSFFLPYLIDPLFPSMLLGRMVEKKELDEKKAFSYNGNGVFT